MKITLVVNRGLDGKFTKIKEDIKAYRDLYLQGMAEQLILNSPVDTGTYITSHNIGSAGGFTSSAGKPRNQPYQPFAQAGLNKLFQDIQSLSDTAARVNMSNSAEHADLVEFDLGYAPYTRTAREHNNIARRAAAQAKG